LEGDEVISSYHQVKSESKALDGEKLDGNDLNFKKSARKWKINIVENVHRHAIGFIQSFKASGMIERMK
jgi:hypothetical protein